MADRKDSKIPSKGGMIKKKEKKVEKVENKPEKEKEKNKDKGENATKKPEKTPENQQINEETPQGNGEVAEGAKGPVKDEEFELEPMELPPFEIIVGYVRYLSLIQTGSHSNISVTQQEHWKIQIFLSIGTQQLVSGSIKRNNFVPYLTINSS